MRNIHLFLSDISTYLLWPVYKSMILLKNSSCYIHAPTAFLYNVAMELTFFNPIFRHQLRKESRSIHQTPLYAPSPVYLIDFFFRHCPVTTASVCIDLGSGLGQLSYYASTRFHIKSIGIELFSTFVTLSQRLSRLFRSRSTFIQGDIFLDKYPEGSHYIVSGTCFSDDDWEKVVSQLIKIPSQAYIMSFTHPLPDSHFSLICCQQLIFEWGPVHVLLYRRL